MKRMLVLCAAMLFSIASPLSAQIAEPDQKIVSSGYVFTLKTEKSTMQTSEGSVLVCVQELWWGAEKVSLARMYGLPIKPLSLKALRVQRLKGKNVLVLTLSSGMPESFERRFLMKSDGFGAPSELIEM
ncbi:MAG: hypothetical protein V4478_01690 [Patescibacteria group bacterium]